MLTSRGRVKQVKLHRNMTPNEVKDAILQIFKSLQVTSFVVLEVVESGHSLVRAENQNIDAVE